MIASIGRAVALSTHANAFLAGHDVNLEISTNKWFGHVRTIRFRIGTDETRGVEETIGGWFSGLRGAGFTSAYLWCEPTPLDIVYRVAFVGNERWAPVTVQPARQIIWHATEEFNQADQELPWRLVRSGYEIQPGQSSLSASTEEAAAKLDAALEAMIEFQKRNMPGDEGTMFARMFEGGRKALTAVPPWDEPALAMFPPDLYPAESYRLASAVGKSWALGGMGWWNDHRFDFAEITAEFDSVTLEYFTSMSLALYAACKVDLR